MIQLKNLSFCYSDTDMESLSNIDLHIRKGEFIVLTGESGCGKTTLTRILNGLCPQFFEGKLQGEYLLSKKNALAMSLDEIGLEIGNVFQDPRSQFFTTNTTDEIVMAMENRNYPFDVMEERLRELSALLHLQPLLDRNIFELSSGEKQKIAIAAACAIHPEIVVLDEPSANLDAEGTQQLSIFLKTLKARGMTIVISEHRLHYLASLLDQMIVMEKGRIKHVYTAQEAKELTPEQMVRMGLRLMNPLPQTPCNAVQNTGPLIEISSLCYKRKKTFVLENLSMAVSAGKVVAITGKNGAGKSTLCKIITGLLKETSGSVSIHRQSLKKTARIKLSFFVGQDADYQLYAANVWDEVTLNLRHTEDLDAAANDILDRLNLSAFKQRHPVSLSGGQKQRVLLAAAMLRKRKLLVLDEPTSGLDGKHMRIIADILRAMAKQGATVLLITHDTEFIQLVADEVFSLHDKASDTSSHTSEVFFHG